MPASLSGVNLVDPQTCLIDFAYRNLPTESWAGKVNSFTSPVERDYGVGRVLIRRSDMGLLADTNDLTLKFTDTDGTSVSFPKLSLIQTENILPFDNNGSGSILMLTLADRRYRYSQVFVGRTYNYRDINTGEYTPESMNGGVAWSGSGIADDIWNRIRAAFPDAGFRPSFAVGSEGFDFTSENAWHALCRLAQAGGSIIRYDPVQCVLSVPSNTPMPESVKEKRVWDTDDAYQYDGPIPETVRVSFPRPGYPTRHTEEYAVPGGTANDTVNIAHCDMPAVGDPLYNQPQLLDRAQDWGALWIRDWQASKDERQVEFRGYIDWCRTAVGYDGYNRWSVYDLGDSAERRGPLSTSIERGPVLVQSMGTCCGSLNGGGSGSGGGSASGTGDSGSGTGSGSGSGSGDDSGSGSGGSGSGGGETTFEIIDEICPIYADDDECCGITMAEAEAAFQPLDADLTEIAALNTTPYGRPFLTLTDAAAARTYIGAGTGNGDAFVANPLSQFASTTSAQLASVISDETGSGFLVFSDSPAFTSTPTAPTASPGTNTTQIATTAFVQAALGSSNAVPAGVSVPWPTAASVPSGWVEVGIGGTASRTTAAGLFAAYGTSFGVGDGSTTFGLPDWRGRTLLGAGTGSGLTARTNLSTGGAETHALSSAENGPHTHTSTLMFFNKSPAGTFNISSVAGTNDTVETKTSDSSGSGTAHNNMQPWFATRWITPTN